MGVPESSLVPEGHHRIQAGCPTGGNIAGHQTGHQNEAGRGGHGDRIVRGNLPELIGEETIGAEARHQPHGNANGQELRAGANDGAEHVAAIRAERHPDGDLLGSTRHGVGHHPIDAGRDEQETGPRKGGEDDHGEPRLGVRRPERSFEGEHRADRDAAVNGAKFSPDGVTCFDTDVGARQVEDIPGRIAHGVVERTTPLTRVL
jgi:hypothetical protein